MHVRITGDVNHESGLGEVIVEISGPTRKHFLQRDYGLGLAGLCIVLMCRHPDLEFKQRVRLEKAKKTLYLDVMLSLRDMAAAEHDKRRAVAFQEMRREVSKVLTKYKFQQFDTRQFLEDLSAWFGTWPSH